MNRKPKMKRIVFIATTAVAMVLVCKGCMDKSFYYPTRQIYGAPQDHGIDYEDIHFESADGTKLHGWFIKATYPEDQTKGTIIHFHGNAQNMTSHFEYVIWLVPAGYNLFVFDYRGYGQSEGTVSRAGIHQDSVAALRTIRQRRDIDQNKLLVIGQSLGGANALAALAEDGCQGVLGAVIDSTFYSYRKIAEEKAGQIPLIGWFKKPIVNWLISAGYDPVDSLDKIDIPLVFIHGTEDQVIPWQHSQMLSDKAGKHAELWLQEGAEHTEAFYQPFYQSKILEFFDRCSASKAKTSD